MASTYSALKIELIATGEQSGTWGATTNVNLGTALEEAIVGRANAVFASDADLTITLTNANTTQVARNYILDVTSGVSLSATRNLIVPTIDKPYIIENNTTGGQSIIVKTAAGTGVTVPNGTTVMVYADGTNVVQAFDYVPSVTVGTATLTTVNATDVNATTVDATNLEVTNLKAKDGTSAGSIANSTGVVTLASSVLTTTDINGGTIDNASIGASTRSTGAFTTLTSNGATTFTAGTASTTTTTGTAVITGGLGVSGRINAANIDGIIGANTAAAGTFTSLSSTSGALNGTVGATTPAAGTFTSLTDSGNLTFTGTGNRILGDFSNATASNRVMFQSSTTNGNTVVSTLPNGTATTSALRLYGTSDTANNANLVMSISSTLASIESQATGTGTYLPMTIYTGGSERMRIDTSGRVVIGSTLPRPNALLAVQFDAGGTVNTAADFRAYGTSPSINLSSAGGTFASPLATAFNPINIVGATTSDGTNFNNTIGFVGGIEATPTAGSHPTFFAFATTPSGSTTRVERMRIDSSGNVGIGTSSPANRLDVRASGDTTASIQAIGGTNGAGFLRLLGSDNSTFSSFNSVTSRNADLSQQWYMGGDGNVNTLVFKTSTSERMRIDSSGNVLFNTTDTTLFNNTSGNGVCYRANASLDIAASGDNCLILNRMTSTGPITEFRYAGTIVGTITVTGSETAYNTSSDYRLKENIAPMTGALNTISQLKPVTYNWKADGSDGQGFIAHELAEVVPDCVSGEKDAVDAEGNPVYQGVDTSFLVATLTAALQEAHGLIKDLEARLVVLESK